MTFDKLTWVDKSSPSFNPLIHPELTAQNLNRYENAFVALNNDKVDKVVGKGLSSNDFTNDDKNKVTSLTNSMVSSSVDKTVGSGKDFPTLNEALIWVSSVGAIGAGAINLILDDGTYQLGQVAVDIQLDDTIPSMYQIQNIRLNIKSVSSNKSNCTISIRSDLNVTQKTSILQMVKSVCTFTNITINQSILGYSDASKYIDFISGYSSSIRFNYCDIKNVTYMSFIDSSIVSNDTSFDTIDTIKVSNSAYMNIGANSQMSNAVNGFFLEDMSKVSIKGVNIVNSIIANIPLNAMQEDGSYIIDGTVKLAQPYSGATLTEASIVDNLTSNETTKTLSANQGSVLKGLIDGISAILSVDDASFDELQEIVNFIKLNKDVLSVLTVDAIIGLRDELDLKLDVAVPVLETALALYQPDLFTNTYFEYTLDQNSELENPRGMLKGRTGKIVLKQDATGGRTVTFDHYYQFPFGEPVLNTDSNALNVFNYTVMHDSCIILEYMSDFIATGVVLDEALAYDNTNIGTEFIA